MSQASLVRVISDRLSSPDMKLPVFNPVAMKLLKMIQRDDYSGEDLAIIIQQDQALTAHVIKVANSALYAGLSPAKTVKEAAFRLGADNLAEVVHTITQKGLYSTKVKQFKGWVNRLWGHSLGTAIAAKWLAQNLDFNNVAEEAFMAGLLHDIGKLVELLIIEDLLVRRQIKTKVSAALVMELMEKKHSQHGRQYLEMQHLPKLYPAVAAHHHTPNITGKNLVLDLVRLANRTCLKLGIGLNHKQDITLEKTPEAIHLKATRLILAKLQVKLEEYLELVDSVM